MNKYVNFIPLIAIIISIVISSCRFNCCNNSCDQIQYDSIKVNKNKYIINGRTFIGETKISDRGDTIIYLTYDPKYNHHCNRCCTNTCINNYSDKDQSKSDKKDQSKSNKKDGVTLRNRHYENSYFFGFY